VLAAKAADGSVIADDAAVLELHHFNIAGYLVFSHFAATLAELARRPEVKKKLSDEIRAKAPSGPLTLEQLAAMPYLESFVKELKRYTPLVSVFFGKAKRDFEIGGFRVPEGWMVLWGSHATNLHEESFVASGEFDPDRFSPVRAEDKKKPNAFSPQGAGELPAGHKCAGFDYSTLFMQVFAVVAARDFEWTLPEQDLSYDYGIVPPEHRSGLRVALRRKA
jgi:cytochrome P450